MFTVAVADVAGFDRVRGVPISSVYGVHAAGDLMGPGAWVAIVAAIVRLGVRSGGYADFLPTVLGVF